MYVSMSNGSLKYMSGKIMEEAKYKVIAKGDPEMKSTEKYNLIYFFL